MAMILNFKKIHNLEACEYLQIYFLVNIYFIHTLSIVQICGAYENSLGMIDEIFWRIALILIDICPSHYFLLVLLKILHQNSLSIFGHYVHELVNQCSMNVKSGLERVLCM